MSNYDEVYWIRNQIMLVEVMLIATAVSAVVGSGLGLLICMFYLLPSLLSLLVNLMEYSDTQT